MRLVKYLMIGLMAAGAAACSKNTDGNLVTLDPLAGLRYVNLVSDTGAMDFRIIDIVGNAPNTVAATFRTGGSPFGVLNPVATQPPYSPVRAGTRHIRVFMNGTTAAIASTQMFDTTLTFVANTNYTFYMYGAARSGAAGRCCSVLVVKDSVPAIAANKWALRVLDLSNDFTGSPAAPAAGTPVDVRIGPSNGPTPSGAAAAQLGVIPNQALGNLSNYVLLDTTGSAAASVPAYRAVVATAGTSTPAIFQALLPTGTRGSATANPLAGTSVGGTAITMVIVPRSTPASLAPQTAAALVSTNIDSLVRSNDTVSVWRHIAPATATVCATPAAAGANVNDVLNVAGLAQPEYNGVQTVVSSSAGTAQTLWSQKTVTLTGGAGAFTMSFGGATTTVLPFNATASQLETAIGALATIGAANVSVTGVAGGPFTVLFQGTFTNATAGTLSASANGGLTVTSVAAPVGCGTVALVTRDTVTFTGAVATDSFKVTVNGQSTPFLAANAPTATIQTAILALTSVGTGNATVTGAAGGPYVTTFVGTLNNQTVAFAAAMQAGSTGTLAAGKSAYIFSGNATQSRFRYRISGAPVALATGAPTYKIVTNTNDFTMPTAIFLFDAQPPRTAP